MKSIFKEFENLSVEKRRFRMRWDSSPGRSRLAIERPGLESQRSRKLLFFPQKDFKFLNLNVNDN